MNEQKNGYQKAAIYCRLSEEDKNKRFETDDSESIQNQKNMLVEYAMNNGWVIYDIYSDDDYTGSDRSRPEFNRLLDDAKARKFNIILCKTQSRFTREVELVERYIHGLFQLWNIRFISIVDNADTANKGNKKSRQINALINEWYLEDMSSNIKSVLESKRRQGIHIGSFALYGYKKDPDKKGHLIIDETAAAVVRDVFSLYAQGYGRTAIARILNSRGIPNPTEYKRLCGLRYKPPASKNSTLWRYPAISSMLSNEIYIGNMVQGKYESISYKTKKCKPRPKSDWYVVENTHEPIIDRELWSRVQTMLDSRAKPFAEGKIGIFSEKVFCAECGYALRSSKNHGKHYLRCATRYASKDACGGCFISVDSLERAVISELNRITDEYLDCGELEERINLSAPLESQKKDICSTLSTLKKTYENLSKGIRELYMDKVKGLITEADFVALSAELKSDIQVIEGQTLDLQEQLASIDALTQSDQDIKYIIEKHIHPEHLTREMTEELIDKILVARAPTQDGGTQITVRWNF